MRVLKLFDPPNIDRLANFSWLVKSITHKFVVFFSVEHLEMKDEAILLYDKIVKVTVFFSYLAEQLEKSVLRKKEKKLVTLFLVTPLLVTPLRGLLTT